MSRVLQPPKHEGSVVQGCHWPPLQGGVSAPFKVLVNEPFVAGGLATCSAQ